MAKPPCTFCGKHEGVMMATTLDDGDTQVACGNCMPAYAIGLATAIIGGMSKAEAGAYSDALDQMYASDPRGPKAPPAKPGGRRRKADAPDVPPDGPPEAAAVTVALDPPCTSCGSEAATGDAEKLTCNGCGLVIATADESQPS